MNTQSTDKLDKLSPEELGKLFPISLVEHQAEWQLLFEQEKQLINAIIGNYALRIEHIGSTAVPNIKAKPIIDILVETLNNQTIKDEIIAAMKAEGYIFILRKDRPPAYLSFLKGYTNDGYKGHIFHIYMAEKTHTTLWNRLHFRDYLVAHEDVAKEYERLKEALAMQHKYDREAYTSGKNEFVERTTQTAKHYCQKV
ncbi:MAG: GrpB family protein [Bacteroidota bacterium]